MNPLYQALICCFVKLVLSMRNCMSSLGSFLLAPTPIPGAVYRANPSSSSSSSSRLAYFESLDGAGVLPMYLVTRSNHWLVALHSHLHMHTRYTASEWVFEWVVVSVALIHRRRKCALIRHYQEEPTSVFSWESLVKCYLSEAQGEADCFTWQDHWRRNHDLRCSSLSAGRRVGENFQRRKSVMRRILTSP